jgi:hypothetical protein
VDGKIISVGVGSIGIVIVIVACFLQVARKIDLRHLHLHFVEQIIVIEIGHSQHGHESLSKLYSMVMKRTTEARVGTLILFNYTRL